MRDVAKLKRDVVFDTVRLETDTDYSPAVSDEATEVTTSGRIAEIFNDIGASLTSIVPRATELERHINNTPWITSRLTQEDKQKVASFSEVVADLRDTLDPASNLTPEQQLVRLSSQYSKLQEITDIVDRVLNDRINDRILDEREQQQEIARFKALSERSQAQLESRPKVEEAEEVESSDKVDDLYRLAMLLGISGSSIGALSSGLRLRRKIKDQKALQERIRDSFSAAKNLSPQEKNLVVATAGNLALMTYDKDFPQKLARTLNLLAQYDSYKHGNAVDWLANEGFEVSEKKSAQEAYTQLVFSANGGSPNQQVLAEIRRNFPYHIGEDVARLAKSHNGNGKAYQVSEVPLDFEVAYRIARMLSTHQIASLMRDVFVRLNIGNVASDVSIAYKVDDISAFLRQKYSSRDIPDEVKPLFNAIYHLLEGSQIESPQTLT